MFKFFIGFYLLIISTFFCISASAQSQSTPTRYQNIKTTDDWASGFLDIAEDPFHNTQEMTFKGLFGSKYNRLELYSNEAELNPEGVQYADMDVFYWRMLNKSWAIKGGANYFYQPSDIPYWQPGVGLEGTAFWKIDNNIRIYLHEDSVKLDAEFIRDFRISHKIFVKGSIRSILATKTVTEDEIGNGLNQMRYFIRPYYRLIPGLNVFVEYEYLQDYGTTENIREELDEEAAEHLIFLGLSFDF